ncbi:MAG: aminodeoxychorismate synthase component I [Armatimonadota bacterium]|nr:aminodeoxychorismate synthase component I [bacterium]MDW8320930.1 aminodeoxychorismate synthase component I [Armatimonadota bacterium]
MLRWRPAGHRSVVQPLRPVINITPSDGHLAQIVIPLPAGLSVQEIYTRLPLNQVGAVVLDSAKEPSPAGRYPLARYCIVAQEPFGILEGRVDGAWWHSSGSSQFIAGNPLQLLQVFLKKYPLPPVDYPAPLPAGAIGFLNYRLKALVEPCPNRLPAPNSLPLYWFGFYDAIAAIDLRRREVVLMSTGFPEEGDARVRRAQQRLQQLIERWQNVLSTPCSAPVPAFRCGEAQAYWSRREYIQAHQRIKSYIAAGDVYQVNLAQMFRASFEGSPAGLFLRARTISPVPFGAYLQANDFAVISLSPERFLYVCPLSRRIQTRPIKGTRARGRNSSEDLRYADDLLHSPKDRAEHVMIVDLERNDLGRVAQTGTVQVTEFMALEGFAQVYHLTSTVEATLRAEVDVATLLGAVFPGGSITGAPKIRAMQIIEEVEPVAREVYTGSIGYIGFHGGIDLNIAIRTAVVRNGKLTFYAGGGIVADSDAEQEYEETLVKATGWLQAIRSGEGDRAHDQMGLVQRTSVR